MSDRGENAVEESTQAGSAPRHAAPRARGRFLLRGVLVAFVAVALVAGGYAVWVLYCEAGAVGETAEVPATEVTAVEASDGEGETEELPDNPIDFAALQAGNPDVYAWICVPNTNVNYPVLQSSDDDGFYLNHDADGNYSATGAVYSQMCNATDFSDPVTVIYGHNMASGAMFATLHYFEDASFFAENGEFYLYMPGHVLTYEVVSAYIYDNRHILNSFDFSDAAVLRSYFDFVVAPDSVSANVREGVTLADGDRIVQLSTCNGGSLRSSTRYLVTGVLVDDQETK